MKHSLTQSRRSILLIAVVFVVPILFAKLALQQHWLNYGVTNKGELIKPSFNLADVSLNQPELAKHWLLLVVQPNNCDQNCAALLKSINNTYVALGEEMRRAKPVLVSNHALTEQAKLAMHSKAWQIVELTGKQEKIAKQPQVFLVDTLGNFVLRYQPPETSDNLALFGKAILSDFKKLLKYSRIG